jgi:non-specific serine/threonine protein kinase
MSTIAMGMGDTELALAEARRATDIAEALGHTTNQARAQVSLARLAHLGGDTGQATISYRKALVLWNSIDTHWWKVDPLIGLAEIAADRAHAIEAAKLLGAADALIAEEEVSGTSYAFPFTKAAYGRIETISCGILGPEQFEAARRDGRILAFDDVLRIVDTIAPLATSTAHESRLAHAGKLSARELDILQLAARGLTDEEIAGNLFLSRRTVSNHVSHILAKLDVTTRGKAVAKAGMMGILPPLHSDR